MNPIVENFPLPVALSSLFAAAVCFYIVFLAGRSPYSQSVPSILRHLAGGAAFVTAMGSLYCAALAAFRFILPVIYYPYVSMVSFVTACGLSYSGLVLGIRKQRIRGQDRQPSQVTESEGRCRTSIEQSPAADSLPYDGKLPATAMIESEERYRRLFEFCPESILIFSDLMIIYANPAAVQLLRAASREELIGRSVLSIVHPAYIKKAIERLGIVKEGGSVGLFEQKFIRNDGSTVFVESASTSIPFGGNRANVSFIRDISQRKEAEEIASRAKEELKRSEERYNRLQTSLDTFSEDISGIMNMAELELRLIKEVQRIYRVRYVCMIEWEDGDNYSVRGGTDFCPNAYIPVNLPDLIGQLEIGETILNDNVAFTKIGEIRGRTYVLHIGDKSRILDSNPNRQWLRTVARFVNVLYENFHVINDLAAELEQLGSLRRTPPWLLRLLFNISENERKRLSQDLHDGALQEQIIWYRKLEMICSEQSTPAELKAELDRIREGLLDVIYQVRLTCNELRPPFLKEWGLKAALEVLFQDTQKRSDYVIRFECDNKDYPLNDEQLLAIYRIVQELLANASKHSDATLLDIYLDAGRDEVRLAYRDNGVGFEVDKLQHSFKSMGICGIRERVRSLEGTLQLESRPGDGVSALIRIPLQAGAHVNHVTDITA